MRRLFLGISTFFVVAAGAAATGRAVTLNSLEETVPDKMKFCSLTAGCPDVGERLCAEIHQEVWPPYGTLDEIVFCYMRE